MKQTTTEKSLFFRITNTDSLENGTLPTHSFDRLGGTIGSRGANWLLHDYSGDIEPVHAEVILQESHFCIIDRSGKTRLNGAMESIGRNRIVQLNDGDILIIGKYKLKISINDEITRFIGSNHRLSQYEVADMVDAKARQKQSDHLMTHSAEAEAALLSDDETEAPDESILIDEPPKAVTDPLYAMDSAWHESNEEQRPLGYGKNLGLGEQAKTSINYTGTSREAIQQQYKTNSGGSSGMKKEQKDAGQQNWTTDYHPNADNAKLNHVVAAPLLRGMQATLEEMDTTEAHSFLMETGNAIKAMIDGIQKLYADDRDKSLNTALLSRNLQPIEDNPLRLRQSYQQTVQALFSPRRSRVHLSPHAAVSESLAQLDQHQDAIIKAIEESLLTLLKAFSPETMLRRFAQYAKAGDPQNNSDAWAWQMYNHYYSELISSRQMGFEKLFWEVFEQTYDRAMRQPINH